MKHARILFIFSCLLFTIESQAQKILPGITVKNFGGKIIVSWQNQFSSPVSNILVQRSYDSLKNYSTIGTVLNPQNKENGYADVNPPYNKMYYRVSVYFEGGTYVISAPERPVKDIPVTVATENPQPGKPREDDNRYPWELNKLDDSIVLIAPPKKENEITYPSERIYTSRENNIVIHLKDAATKKYTAKFYNDKDSLLFELTKLYDEYLILEKVNFVHAGWFHFEIFENGKLIEKNKFQISSKEGKAGNK